MRGTLLLVMLLFAASRAVVGEDGDSRRAVASLAPADTELLIRLPSADLAVKLGRGWPAELRRQFVLPKGYPPSDRPVYLGWTEKDKHPFVIYRSVVSDTEIGTDIAPPWYATTASGHVFLSKQKRHRTATLGSRLVSILPVGETAAAGSVDALLRRLGVPLVLIPELVGADFHVSVAVDNGAGRVSGGITGVAWKPLPGAANALRALLPKNCAVELCGAFEKPVPGTNKTEQHAFAIGFDTGGPALDLVGLFESSDTAALMKRMIDQMSSIAENPRFEFQSLEKDGVRIGTLTPTYQTPVILAGYKDLVFEVEGRTAKNAAEFDRRMEAVARSFGHAYAFSTGQHLIIPIESDAEREPVEKLLASRSEIAFLRVISDSTVEGLRGPGGASTVVRFKPSTKFPKGLILFPAKDGPVFCEAGPTALPPRHWRTASVSGSDRRASMMFYFREPTERFPIESGDKLAVVIDESIAAIMTFTRHARSGRAGLIHIRSEPMHVKEAERLVGFVRASILPGPCRFLRERPSPRAVIWRRHRDRGLGLLAPGGSMNVAVGVVGKRGFALINPTAQRMNEIRKKLAAGVAGVQPKRPGPAEVLFVRADLVRIYSRLEDHYWRGLGPGLYPGAPALSGPPLELSLTSTNKGLGVDLRFEQGLALAAHLHDVSGWERFSLLDIARPSWQREPPARAMTVAEWTPDREDDHLDFWGNPRRVLPEGPLGIRLVSGGPDGNFGTDDDIFYPVRPQPLGPLGKDNARVWFDKMTAAIGRGDRSAIRELLTRAFWQAFAMRSARTVFDCVRFGLASDHRSEVAGRIGFVPQSGEEMRIVALDWADEWLDQISTRLKGARWTFQYALRSRNRVLLRVTFVIEGETHRVELPLVNDAGTLRLGLLPTAQLDTLARFTLWTR